MGKRESNAGLARLIREAGWTHAQLARQTNLVGTEANTPLRYDESSVTHWLGGTMPREGARRCIVEALRRKLNRHVTYAEAGFPPPGSGGFVGVEGSVEELIELGRSDMDPSRRGVLGVGLFSVALTIPGWQDVLGRAEAIKSGRANSVGMPEVQMVRDMTAKVSELDDQFGGRHARPMAAAFLVNTVADYLRADASPEVRRAMMGAASELCYLTGYMAVDEGLHGLAQRYYLKALELAGGAGDHLMYCTTLRGMSVQAGDLAHGKRSLELADAASAASPTAGPRMRAFLAGQQAHAAALVGDRTRALRHIREAETAMDRAESQSKPFGSYDPAALSYHTSQVRYELGDIAGSVDAMSRADHLRFGVYRRARVRHRGTLGERQFQLGHLEAACETWTTALDEWPLVQSGRVDDRMRTMVQLIRPHTKNAHARTLYDQARATLPTRLIR
ncbi:tetratricopeptide repeat protein [Streptomyces sp. NPDC003860]